MAAAIFERFLRYPGSAIFLGKVEERAVASCTLVVVPNLTRGGQPYGLIENVVAHRGYRRRGYGRRLLDAATQAAWAAGCYKLIADDRLDAGGDAGLLPRGGVEPSKTGFQKRRIAARPEG